MSRAKRVSAAARRAAARSLRAHLAAERLYVRELVAAFRDYHAAISEALRTPRADASIFEIGSYKNIKIQAGAQLRDRAGKSFAKMASAVSSKNSAALAPILGVDATRGVGGSAVASAIKKGLAANLDLVDRAGEGYAAEVDAIVLDAPFGLRVEDLAEEIERRAEVSASRAELIARDQTLKLNGQITQARQEAGGISRYVWSTSGDERVREAHAELDGQVFDWSDPPEVSDDGRREHPGGDYQCRCVAVPVVEEAEGLDL